MHLIFDPTVQLIAGTHFYGPADNRPMKVDWEDEGHHQADLIEYAGRGCYNSYHKPNPATAAPGDYLKNVIKQRHYSVLEHVTFSFYIEGVSRNWVMEATRHRHLSWSVQSGRYVDPVKAKLGAVVPPTLPRESLNSFMAAHTSAVAEYTKVINSLRDYGFVGKSARETARAFLPGSLESRLVVSGNVRSWLEFISKRDHPAADVEMQKVTKKIWEELAWSLPEVFSKEIRELWDSESWQGEVSHP